MKSSNFSVKRDCGTGVVSPSSLYRAAAPYLQRYLYDFAVNYIAP